MRLPRIFEAAVTEVSRCTRNQNGSIMELTWNLKTVVTELSRNRVATVMEPS